MFARMVECSVKPGKLHEFNLIIRNDLILNLRRQPGFIDVVNLVAATEPDHAVILSLWRRQEDAERYHREQFSQVLNRIDHLLKATPDVRTFHVDVSTVHKVAVAA
ncbi:MAG TPA: antibiotic biosynthesis monooxygenase [Terriglobales bacterium]|nr:antibiotic biosynthesis monooxygenase [Terriglobales bacterium]HXZ28305.1 antibiotic biosynthesis monooxygenase [Terriglobales bacterium]